MLDSKAEKPTKIVLCVPTITRPYKQTIDSIRNAVSALDECGYDHYMVSEIGCPYVSAARATMMRKALDINADIMVFIDHDISFTPDALIKLIKTDGGIVGGTYRYKKDIEEYMGVIFDDENAKPIVRDDGCIKASFIPAGFLKVTKEAVDRFMSGYPHLTYGPKYHLSVDFFNHGAFNGSWYGEDAKMCRNWIDLGGDIWLIPDLDLTHHGADGTIYHGNFHEYLLAQPGGSKDPALKRN